jgi:hypothetical protein
MAAAAARPCLAGTAHIAPCASRTRRRATLYPSASRTHAGAPRSYNRRL